MERTPVEDREKVEHYLNEAIPGEKPEPVSPDVAQAENDAFDAMMAMQTRIGG